MAPKDLNVILTFVYTAETASNCLDLILAQISVEQLSISQSYKHSAKMIFAIQLNFHLTDKIADFLCNKHCFLIPKRNFYYFWAFAEHWAAFFSLCGC